MKADKWVVAEHHSGVPDITRVYKKVIEDLDTTLGADEMLFKTLYVSVDPYLQGIALDTPIGDHMGADSIMEVLEAGPNAAFRPGDLVQGFGGWRSHLVSDGAPKLWQTGTFPMVFPAFRKLDPAHYDDQLPITTALGVLGGPGMTAWGTIAKFLTIAPGDTMLISGASGALGTLLGQLAKRAGGRVIGSTSTSIKAAYLTDLGFDAVIRYRQGDDVDSARAALQAAAPNGIDKYFDSLGGAITDAAFSMLNVNSQVAVCWQWATQVGAEYTGPRLLPYIMFPRTTIRGIFSLEWFTEQNWAALHEEVGRLIRCGEISYSQTVWQGFDDIPTAYRSLYVDRTATRGKVLVEL